MSVIAEVFAGLGSGVLQGIGTLAKDLRTAITGEEAITGEKKGELLLIAARLEATLASAEVEVQKAQIEVNKIEAASGSLFRGGWRPLAGWASVGACLVYPVMRAILPWGVAVASGITGHDISWIPQLPALDTSETFAVLGALLGFGGFRSFEKYQGVSGKG